MAEIISLVSHQMPDSLVQQTLKDILNNSGDLQEVLVFFKDKNNNVDYINSGFNILELSYFIQLLTADVQSQILPAFSVEADQ